MTYGFELRAEHNLVHLVQILPIAFSAGYKKETFPNFGKRIQIGKASKIQQMVNIVQWQLNLKFGCKPRQAARLRFRFVKLNQNNNK